MTGRHLGGLGLIPAVLAAGALLIGGPSVVTPRRPPGRTTSALAWPGARRADIPGNLADGPLFQAELFIDATTAVGTAPTPDGTALRLLIRNPDGSVRQLRRLPIAADPQFDQVTADGDNLFWTETSASRRWQIWTAPLRGGPARRLTADTGNATFYGNQYDLVVAGGRLYWTALSADTKETQIRSVALAGGPVQVRNELGVWALSAWPWLTDDGSQAGTRILRNLNTGREISVATSGPESLNCNPVWCLALVMNTSDLDHIDLVHPDGTGRRRIAGSGAQTVVADVAVLDRFQLLSEPGPNSDLTGTATLLVYDLRTGNTVTLSAVAGSVFTRNGVVWWSTGDQEVAAWHSLDLRTV
jgi:hypothetical protein